MTFKILIQKAIAYYPRHRLKTKWIEMDFADGIFNHSMVFEKYPGFEVSMFWPKK